MPISRWAFFLKGPVFSPIPFKIPYPGNDCLQQFLPCKLKTYIQNIIREPRIQEQLRLLFLLQGCYEPDGFHGFLYIMNPQNAGAMQ